MREPVTLFYGRRFADRFEFSVEDSHHLCRVLRRGPGDHVWAIDGQGGLFAVELDSVAPRRAAGRIRSEHHRVHEPAYDLTLVQGQIQQSRMDWLVEKATEQGVTRIRPLSGRIAVGPGRLRRWERISRAAAKQCYRSRVPTIHEPAPLDAVLETLSGSALRLVADPAGSPALPDLEQRPAVVLAVGPDRGFAPGDRSLLEAGGFRPVALGPRRLRAETAALAFLALVEARWGGTAEAAPWAGKGRDDNA